MKKRLKRGLVLMLVLIHICLLCGCKALDTMRANQAFYDEDGNILWNGSVYKPLPTCEYLQPEMDYEIQVCVTEKDVPVLLSDVFAQDILSSSKDRVILQSDWSSKNYCREDKFQQISDRIKAGFETEIVCYRYRDYDKEAGEYVFKYYNLTQEQRDALTLIAETVEPMQMGEGWYLDYDWTVELEECSQDMLFRRQNLDIAAAGQQYYLLLYTDTETLTFVVPDGCKATFDEIVRSYLEAAGIYREKPDENIEDVNI